MVAMHIKKIKYSMLYVTCVYLRDTVFVVVIFLLSVSGLSVCSSCELPRFCKD